MNETEFKEQSTWQALKEIVKDFFSSNEIDDNELSAESIIKDANKNGNISNEITNELLKEMKNTEQEGITMFTPKKRNKNKKREKYEVSSNEYSKKKKQPVKQKDNNNLGIEKERE